MKTTNKFFVTLMSLIAIVGIASASTYSTSSNNGVQCVTDSSGNVLFCPNGVQVASVGNALSSNAISQIGLASNSTGLLGLVVMFIIGALGIIILIKIITPILQTILR